MISSKHFAQFLAYSKENPPGKLAERQKLKIHKET
jgi:hypothetical protein